LPWTIKRKQRAFFICCFVIAYFALLFLALKEKYNGSLFEFFGVCKKEAMRGESPTKSTELLRNKPESHREVFNALKSANILPIFYKKLKSDIFRVKNFGSTDEILAFLSLKKERVPSESYLVLEDTIMHIHRENTISGGGDRISMINISEESVVNISEVYKTGKKKKIQGTVHSLSEEYDFVCCILHAPVFIDQESMRNIPEGNTFLQQIFKKLFNSIQKCENTRYSEVYLMVKNWVVLVAISNSYDQNTGEACPHYTIKEII
jgi:hypothetical protein